MAFTRSIGKTAPRDGMRVVGINPGPVATDRIEMLLRARAERDTGDAERWREAFAGMAVAWALSTSRLLRRLEP